MKLGCIFGGLISAFLAGFFVLRTQTPSIPEPITPVVRTAVPEAPKTRAKPPNPPDEKWLDLAREVMGTATRTEKCGPYLLLTDVVDRRLLTACAVLARRLDALYEERYGLDPTGDPEEAIFLFARSRSFRAFAEHDGRLPVGYAGYSNAARGFMALYVGDQPEGVVFTTLAHELTHLVNRRALGPNLPPWLSEGLADGLGDTATGEGYLPLEGVRGSEPQARRLLSALENEQMGGIGRLVRLDRSGFDRDVPSFDYEQSALFVRYLLSDEELAPRFRQFLRQLTQESYEAESFLQDLRRDEATLDAGFRVWIRSVVR